MLAEPEVRRKACLLKSGVEDSSLIADVLLLLDGGLGLILSGNNSFFLVDLGFKNFLGSLLLYVLLVLFVQLRIDHLIEISLHNLLLLGINQAIICKVSIRLDCKVALGVWL